MKDNVLLEIASPDAFARRMHHPRTDPRKAILRAAQENGVRVVAMSAFQERMAVELGRDLWGLKATSWDVASEALRDEIDAARTSVLDTISAEMSLAGLPGRPSLRSA